MSRKHGLPLTDLKAPALQKPIAVPRCSAPLLVPLSLTELADKALLPTDSTVGEGDVLYTDAQGCPTLSPTAGVLRTYTAVHHPLYGELICAVIASAPGEENKPERSLNSETADAAAILDAARRTGIIDELDGRPLFEKLREWQGTGCHVIADAVEAEPYASAAFAALCERGDAVRRGLKLAMRAVSATGGNIAVCPVSPNMRGTLTEIFSEQELFFTESCYPVTVYTADATDLVCRIGLQALVSLTDAVETDTAPSSCVLTVAGDAVENPQNVRVPFGTPVQAVLRACGVRKDAAAVIAGDAITGILIPDADVPVVPGMTCLLALTAVPMAEKEPCIGCGRCAASCHKFLLPYEIARRLENMHYEHLAPLHPEDCDGCGACTWVCPAHRDVMRAVLDAGETDGSVFLSWGGNEDA